MAAHPLVHFSPIRADHSYSHQSSGEGSCSDPNSSALARETLASGYISAAVRPDVASAPPQRSPDAGVQRDLSSSPRTHGSVGLARERLNLTATGLPQRVIATIQSARASSTCCAYDGKWHAFENWCVNMGVLAFHSPVLVILTFLQELLDKGIGILHCQSVLGRYSGHGL